MTHYAHRFAGYTVIVTGAGAGIGRATAEQLLAEGSRVIAVDVSGERLATLAQEVDGDLVTVVADITDPDGIEAILAATGERIDGLANVAGIMDGFEPTAEISDTTWDRVLAVNLTGMMRLTRAALPRMLERGRGSIVNVGSEAGLRGSAAGTPYTTSKHAVNGFTVSTAFFYTPERRALQRRGTGARRHQHRGAVPLRVGADAHRSPAADEPPRRRPAGPARRGHHMAAERGCVERLGRDHPRRRRLGGDLTCPGRGRMARRQPTSLGCAFSAPPTP